MNQTTHSEEERLEGAQSQADGNGARVAGELTQVRQSTLGAIRTARWYAVTSSVMH